MCLQLLSEGVRGLVLLQGTSLKQPAHVYTLTRPQPDCHVLGVAVFFQSRSIMGSPAATLA